MTLLSRSICRRWIGIICNSESRHEIALFGHGSFIRTSRSSHKQLNEHVSMPVSDMVIVRNHMNKMRNNLQLSGQIQLVQRHMWQIQHIAHFSVQRHWGWAHKLNLPLGATSYPTPNCNVFDMWEVGIVQLKMSRKQRFRPLILPTKNVFHS